MGPQVVSLVVLVLIFAAGTTLPVNLGVLGFVAAFGVGTLAVGMSTEDIIAGFPGDLFLTLVGVTYLFGIAERNGTVDLLVGAAVRSVRGRAALVPWIFFAVAALLMSIGALFAVAIVAPLALGCARRYGIDPLLMGMLVVHGALGGAFAPTSVYGSFVNGVVGGAGLPGDPVVLALAPLLFNIAAGAVVFALRGGRRLVRLRVEDDAGARAQRVRLDQVLTGGAVLALALGTVLFDLDVGFLALTLSVVLVLVSPAARTGAVERISWSTVLLIGGVLTYVGVLERAGTVDYVSRAVAGMGMPLVAALLLCLIGGIASAFASSVAILGVLIPLSVPFLAQGEIGAVGMVAALAVAATVVDVSPFSTNGALVLANAADDAREALYRRMLAYSGAVVLLGPALAWVVLVVPGLL
ncbi:SLC13 family permease [Saccharopolyspora cebuensis]|uniref:SLC13 family permease n=1 Tax=Saccharopolyspora cebuensis TaxID=418759 RepID=A0ABV4CGL6_9PSEU